jgi:signal transduction histidine kinase
MTSPPDDTTTDTSVIIAALRTERDAALARKAALAEELAARAAELLERKSKFDERIEYQAATLDVLRAMSASPGDPQPVFQLIVERARAFCDADQCNLALLDGDTLHLEARSGSSASYPAQFPRPVDATSTFGRAIIARDVVQMPDVLVDPDHFRTTLHAGAKVRAVVAVPLLRRGAPVGAIAMGRNIPGKFSVTQTELLKTFAEQAVMAITSAETYRALRTRTADLQESLEYQTATSDVLKVISRSTFDLQPVLDTLVETAARLCDADQAVLARPEGDLWRLRANFGFPPEFEAYQRKRGLYSLDPHAPNVSARAVRERRPVHIHDVAEVPGYPEIFTGLAKQRTSLGVPLLREGEAIGYIVLARQRVEPFTDKQIVLLENFAAQAVIAMENARLINEQREALEQQTATAEVLQVINTSPGNLTPVFDAMLEKAMRLCGAAFGSFYTYDGDQFHSAAQRGVPAAYAEFRAQNPPSPVPGSTIARALEARRTLQDLDLKALRPYLDGNPGARAMVELGGIRTILAVPLCKNDTVLGHINVYRQEVRAFSDKQIALLENFAAQAVIAMENARLLDELHNALDAAQATLRDLKAAQANLIQAEKMASLGQLTAGIAHEIKNPLNFVNNFAALSVDLLSELKETAAPGFAALTDDQRAEIDDVSAMLTSNLEKITEHGKRADGIVKAMLEHSRGSSAERRMVDLNTLIDEALNLAYHGARAQDQSFNITLERDFGEGIAPIEVNPQDMTRVFLNIFGNGFYAATRRAHNGRNAGFVPMLKVTTRDVGEAVEIRVRDNGTGIPIEIRDKMFQPFFTTKPTGEGTGLGLSITYDIITKQHCGTITVDSEVGAFTEFVVTLARHMFANNGSRA